MPVLWLWTLWKLQHHESSGQMSAAWCVYAIVLFLHDNMEKRCNTISRRRRALEKAANQNSFPFRLPHYPTIKAPSPHLAVRLRTT